MSHATPELYLLEMIYDIESWIEDHVVELHAHTVPECFKFEQNNEGKAVMYHRNWSHEQLQALLVNLKVRSVPFIEHLYSYLITYISLYCDSQTY